MDKQKLILPISILLGCIILGSYIYESQLNKQMSIERQKNTELQANNVADQKTDYFKKKIECEKYTDQVKLDLEQGRIDTKYFEMIFYSPKDNSCLFVYQILEKREYFIYNALTKSKITSFQFPEQWDDYKKFILDYSGGEIRL